MSKVHDMVHDVRCRERVILHALTLKPWGLLHAGRSRAHRDLVDLKMVHAALPRPRVVHILQLFGLNVPFVNQESA